MPSVSARAAGGETQAPAWRYRVRCFTEARRIAGKVQDKGTEEFHLERPPATYRPGILENCASAERYRASTVHGQCMLKGKVKGIYLRGGVFWYARQVNGRRTWISLETNDYAEAVQRAREIMQRPELQFIL